MKGRLIGASPSVVKGANETLDKGSGFWSLREQARYMRDEQWPSTNKEVTSVTVGSAVSAQTGTTITAPLPSNVEAGDILILFGVFSVQASVLSTPSGWTADNSTTSNFLFRKTATGSDTAPSIAKSTTGVDHAAIMFCIKKRNLSIAYGDVDSLFDTDGNISFTAATGTGSFGDLYLYSGFIGGPRTETTAISNMTKLAEDQNDPLNVWYYAIDIGGETVTNNFNDSVRYTMFRYPLS
jgi:hypothetical protein